jgi:RHS repeat-associated protein
LTTDHLGSTRVVSNLVNSQPNVIARHDYVPFGGEIGNIGGRTPAVRYGATDDTRQKFTSKERDAESALDYFIARHYSSAQGRFTSPDEFPGGPRELSGAGSNSSAKGALPYVDIASPQSLNKYQYTYNNPLRYVDPDGHDILVIENGPTQGNPIGHTAVAVTGYGMFSFGNDTKLGSSTSEYVETQAARRDTTLYVIKTTPEQDKAVVDTMMKEDEKGGIGVVTDNCSSRSNRALDTIGVPVGVPVLDEGGGGGFSAVDKNMPGSAGQRAKDLGQSEPDRVTVIGVPKGSTTVPDVVKQFEPRNPNPDPRLPKQENKTGGGHSSS